MTNLRDWVLVVDDDALLAEHWSLILEDMGLEVCASVRTAVDAIAMAHTHRPKLVLMDVRLRGELDGIDAAFAIHELVGSKVIFITGSRDPATAARIQADRPEAVLFKPVSDRQLKTAVSGAILG
jgi:CheY-like chemotaxis protein